ncbi:MAG: MobF family relaxase, partial [Acidimicrobiales bacterium]
EDYYTGQGEASGRWTGSGAAGLGLDGEVDPTHLAALFGQGRDPLTGKALGRPFDHRAGSKVVAGYSLSLSPPKSVSVLWALGGGGVAEQVRAGHDAAVATTVSFLEAHASFSRMGKSGVFQVDTEGLVVATFVHRVSRAVDPQLHTHLLVSNKVRCLDGRWRAVDGRELFAHQKPAGNLYQAALRAELTARLGVEWAPVDANGQADIVGVPEDLCRHFSSRRREIEVAGALRVASAEARLGRSLTADERAEAFQVATFATRPAKGREAEATESLIERWMADAAAFGQSPENWLGHALGRSPAQLGLPLEATADVVAEVVAELAEQRSTWGRTDALRLVARRLPPALVAGAEEARAWIEAGADAVVADLHVVALAAPARAEIPVGLCRRDGRPTTERHGGARYTTRATLALEAEVIDFAGRGREAGVAVASPVAIEAAVVSKGLGEDQAVAVRRVCAGGEAVVCLVGPAGAGKTRSVGAARAAWECSGVPVRGLAVSAVAAGVLTEEAGLASDTLAKFLFENAKPVPERQWRLRAGEAVVLDEASMVATSDLSRLVAAVEEAQAKLVLVGDHRQLGAVGAGGLFRLLVADTAAAELTDARRFVEPWEAAATLRLRRGDPTVADDYERHG